MKLEIIERSTDDPIATYSVPGLTMLDFQEMFDFQERKGPNEIEVTIDLDYLSGTVKDLNSNDPKTQKSEPEPREVDFNLPDPIVNRMISQLKNRGKSADSDEISEDEISERVYTPTLELSTILSAIVMEMLQNHHPHSDYEVKISDG